MQLERIALEDFRNYRRQELCLPPGATILAGENAQGKTNLLEAIFLLTGSRSWRASKRGDLLAFGAPQARIQAQIRSRERDFAVAELSSFFRSGSPSAGRLRNVTGRRAAMAGSAISEAANSGMPRCFTASAISPARFGSGRVEE